MFEGLPLWLAATAGTVVAAVVALIRHADVPIALPGPSWIGEIPVGPLEINLVKVVNRVEHSDEEHNNEG
jgi:hypothetical protein